MNTSLKPDILLTGATGNTGRIIAEELKKRGVPFKAMARSRMRQSEFENAGIPTVMGNFDDPDSLGHALVDVNTAYLVCTPDEKLVARETNFITAAQNAGVRHIVKCSAYLAGVDAETQNLRSHGVIEQALINSGLSYTIIRPHGFMQTFTMLLWNMVQKAHVISLPGGTGKLPLVDVRDVAKVAVKALTEPVHKGKIYNITGPQALDFYQQAEILQRVLGHPVTYLPGSENQLKWAMFIFGVPATPGEHAIKIFRMQREHRLERVHPTLQDLGIRPSTYEEFLADLISGKTDGGNSFDPPDTIFVRMMNVAMPLIMRIRLHFVAHSGRKPC